MKVADLIAGLPLPNHPEAEASVLHLLLDNPDLVLTEGRKLIDDDFYVYANKQTFQVMALLVGRGVKLDLPTIVAEGKALNKTEVTEGHVSGLYIIPDAEPSVGNLPTLMAQIREDAVKRQAMHGMITALIDSKNPGTSKEAMVNRLESTLVKIRNMESDDREALKLSQMEHMFYDELEIRMAHPDGIIGVPTGFHKLDEIVGGFRAGEVVIVSGWTGRGKSTLTDQWLFHAARTGVPSIVYSLEMSASGTMDRIAARTSGIDHRQIRQGRLTVEERVKLIDSLSEFHDLPYYYDEVSGMTARQICSRIRVDKLRKNIGILCVDHIGKLASDGYSSQNREREVSENIGEFDRLADELNIPVIIVSQMNRPFAPNGDMEEPMPSLHKLRESGSLEQMADWVIFVHRPHIRQTSEARIVSGNFGLVEKASLIVAKGRSGESEVMLPCYFDGKHNKFMSELPEGVQVFDAKTSGGTR